MKMLRAWILTIMACLVLAVCIATMISRVTAQQAPITTISSVAVVGDRLEVVWKGQSQFATGDGSSAPRQIMEVWKYIYIARNDSVVFSERIKGRYIPPQTTSEKLLFPTPIIEVDK